MKSILENPRKLLIVDLLLIVPFLILPLLINLPYRVNIFLSWEGAYRLYLGQIPFKDFGLPMGYAYWLVPALFFHLFGPTMIALVKAQVLINLLSLLSLRGLLYNFRLNPFAVTLTLLVFCLSYIIFNFWPWYNNSVVVFEVISLYFLTSYSREKKSWQNALIMAAAGTFSFLSFFTKQDVGAICFLINLFLAGYYSLTDKKILPVSVYLISTLFIASIFIIPLLPYNFTYWFNLGQEPHSSRISPGLIFDIVFSRSVVEKLYIVLILFGLKTNFKTWKDFFLNKSMFSALVISIGLILQSMVTRATSPLPTDHMSYFHTFAFAGLAIFLPWENWTKGILAPLLVITVLLLFHSEGYWKYASGFVSKKSEVPELAVPGSAPPWVTSALPTLDRIKIPKSTESGIQRLLQHPVVNKPGLRALNMTELTSLAYELKYEPQKNQPLWYHLNIGIFEKEVDDFVKKVDQEFYDLVLFESIPSLNNFYPYKVRDKLLEKYKLIDSFGAPRKVDDSIIEVFIKKDSTNLNFQSTQ